MMLPKFFLSAMIAFLSLEAFAYTTKSFKGKLTNFTDVESSRIKIEFGLICEYTVIVDRFSCGEKNVNVEPNADGSFTIPSLTLSPGWFKERFISTYAYIYVDGRPYGNLLQTKAETDCTATDCSFENSKRLLTAFTLIRLPSPEISPVFSSGIDHREFYRNAEMLQLSVYVTAEYKNLKSKLDHEIMTTDSDLNPFKLYLPPYLIIPGALSPSESIKISIDQKSSRCAKSTNVETFEVSPTLNLETIEVGLDDLDKETKLSCIYSIDRLEGRRTMSLQINTSTGEKKTCEYLAELRCEDGKLSGQMTFLGNAGCMDESMTKIIKGTCEKESGDVEFTFNGEELYARLKRTWEFSKVWNGVVYSRKSSGRWGFLILR